MLSPKYTSQEGVVVISGLEEECGCWVDVSWHIHHLGGIVVLEAGVSPEEGCVPDFVHHCVVLLINPVLC